METSENLAMAILTNKQGPRALYIIARDIRKLWPNVYYAAKPYLTAMSELSTIQDAFGYDSARSIVLYFLSNARTWKGDDAKRIKAELQAILKAR